MSDSQQQRTAQFNNLRRQILNHQETEYKVRAFLRLLSKEKVTLSKNCNDKFQELYNEMISDE